MRLHPSFPHHLSCRFLVYFHISFKTLVRFVCMFVTSHCRAERVEIGGLFPSVIAICQKGIERIRSGGSDAFLAYIDLRYFLLRFSVFSDNFALLCYLREAFSGSR